MSPSLNPTQLAPPDRPTWHATCALLQRRVGVDQTVSRLLEKKSSSLRVLSSSLKTSLSKAIQEDFEEYVQDFNEF
ncbi:hypothetical protein U9M48_008478 [Paspalum notatum var. saurae]|uniref:Uncharacterized protein n=1 Tax=Paspalum notatum var. saurae TaxID=547442 RepID=A0AAQ3WDG9_PASNO